MPLLHYVELGDSANQSIVIIHGLFGSHKNWSRISQKLAENYHVIAVDCRNHGDSFNSMNMNYHLMANDVWLIVEHLKLVKPIVIGHSMGGKIAMQLISEHAQSFAQLVVVDIAPVTYHHDYNDLIQPVLDIDITDIKNRKQVDNELKQSIPDDFVRLFLLQSMAHVDKRWYWKLDWQNLLDNMQHIVAAPNLTDDVTIKALFVFGENSDYYNQEGLNAVNEHFSNVNIEVVANGNHWLHYEHAEEFLTILKQYLVTK